MCKVHLQKKKRLKEYADLQPIREEFAAACNVTVISHKRHTTPAGFMFACCLSICPSVHLISQECPEAISSILKLQHKTH